jgi:hypothetical protein
MGLLVINSKLAREGLLVHIENLDISLSHNMSLKNIIHIT